MSTEPAQATWEQIKTLIGASDARQLDVYLDTLTPGEVARAISRLGEEEHSALLTLLEPEEAADLIEELSDTQGADLLEEVPAQRAAAILDEMESADRADVLAGLDEEDAEAILQEMDPEEAREARQLLAYPADTAAGLMVTEFLAYLDTLSVADVLHDMRANAQRYSDYRIQYAYVISETEKLIGVVRLRDLVLSPGVTALTDIMIRDPLRVTLETPLEKLEQIFDRHAYIGVPVIDERNCLVGVVTRAAVEEAVGERADKAFMRFSGIIGGEELRSMSLAPRALRRLSWLSVNLGLTVVAASVIIHYEHTIDAVIALAFFLPVIANMCGCSGNQALAVSIRELTLGLIRYEDFARVCVKEVQVGLINGLLLGSLLGLLTFFWKDNLALALVVGSALALNTVIAAVLGGALPLILRRIRIDPALAAAPIMMTIVDMCGFFLVLSFATITLSQLTR